MARDEELLKDIEIGATHACIKRRKEQLFETKEGSEMLIDDMIFRNREDVVKHCVKIIEDLPIEAACLIARKQQLGTAYETLRALAINRIEKSLSILQDDIESER